MSEKIQWVSELAPENKKQVRGFIGHPSGSTIVISKDLLEANQSKMTIELTDGNFPDVTCTKIHNGVKITITGHLEMNEFIAAFQELILPK